MSYRCIVIVFVLLLFFYGSVPERPSSKIKGLTLVASPDPIPASAFEDIKNVHANWVVINPFAYSNSERSTRIIYDSPRQWWGERPAGIRDAIAKAHHSGIQVLLKPQVWIPGGWVGHVHFDNDAKKIEWRKNYQDYILEMATIAQEFDVAIFCIGTEYDQTVLHDMTYWIDLVKKVRAVYQGKITYAGNWTHYEALEIWPFVDYIGIDAYFPLTESKTPELSELNQAWQVHKTKIERLSISYDKQVIFTEFGYLSVDGCAYEHWKLEPKRATLRTNEIAQATAYRALLETFLPEPWYKGCFLWKWYPNSKASLGEGHVSKDYTPQGKKAEQVLREVYGKY